MTVRQHEMNKDVIRILLVEDSPSDADILQRALRQTVVGRFEFTWVECLEDALAGLRRESYDVLLMDLSLPDSSGPETFRRAQKAAPAMPVVVLTGAHDEALGLAAVREGVQEYLVKGETDGRQIARAIRYAIERKHDLEQQRRAQKERDVTIELLRLVNESSGLRDLIQSAAAFFRQQSGCDAVGIRLEEAGEYPYFETVGFPQEFVLREADLCARDDGGRVIRDCAGNPLLECMCGNVISGRFDPSKPFFTAHGSFWTNSTTELLASATEADLQRRTRNRCNQAGYESVLLIPLRVGDARLGLLQLDALRTGAFTPGSIAVWEGLADQLSVAVAKLRAEEALRRSKEEWEHTFDSVPDLIAILDNRHRIVRANRAMAERLGAMTRECAGLNCFKCVHGTDRPPDFCPHARTLLDGKEHVAEVHEEKLGGDFLVSTTPLRDEFGRMIGSAHVARDITERKRTEEKVRHQNAVLAGLNRILSEALICDSEEELGRACLMVAQDVTRSRNGFIGEIKAGGRLEYISISEAGPLDTHIAGVLSDGKGFFSNAPQSSPLLCAPLKHDGKIIGIIGVGGRDGGYSPQDLEGLESLSPGVVQVLMRKRAERAVRASEERLRQAQKMESIGLLAGGVAHDFNNLLACIMGNASLLREEVFEEKQEKAEAIIRASEKAADLTRQLLAYAGKGRFVVSTHNFSEVVLDMTGLLRASIPKKVNLNLALAPDLPGVEADRGQLQQIVMNLVLNGVEAIGADRSGSLTVATGVRELSEADGLSDEITAGGLAPGSYVWLEVGDTGEGMDEETRKKIFEPFFTTKFLGRGLGLAAVSGIVRSHAGGIRVTSAPGKGSCFTVLFPAVERVAAAASITETDRATEGSGTILVVDDEDLVRAMVKRTLERYGYEVLEADSGVCAVEVLEGHTGDIAAIVLDLSMPGLSGEETLPELRRLRPDVKVLLSSGYAEDEAMRLFQGQQISGFIQKPYTASALAEKISYVIGPGPARPV